MRNYAALLRLSAMQLWASLRGAMQSHKSGRIHPGLVVLIIFAGIGFAVLAGVVVFVQIVLAKALEAVGKEQLLPALMLLISMACTLLMSVFSAFSRLYFNRDNVWLASLPVKSGTVLAVRMTEIYLSELLLNLVLLVPALTMFGLQTSGGAGYWLRAAATVLASSALPMGIIVVLSALLAGCTSIVKHKELALTVGSMLLVAAILTIEMKILPSIPEDADTMFFVRLLLGSSALIDLLTTAVPPVRWAVDGLSGDWGSFAAFIVLSFGFLITVHQLLGRNYLNMCIRQSEQAAQRKQKKDVVRQQKPRSQLKALFIREWIDLLRTPAYVTNGLAEVIVMPLMLVFMGIGMSSEIPAEEILPFVRSFLQSIPQTEQLLLFTVLLAFPGLINPVAATAVSRGARQHDLYRAMPVASYVYMTAKLLAAFSVSFLGTIVTMAAVSFVVGVFPVLMLPASLLALLYHLAVCALSITMDAVKPYFDWTNETQAIKQGMNTLWSMLLALMMLAIPACVWVLMFFVMEVNAELRLIAVLAAVVLEFSVSLFLFKCVGVKCYSRIEG